MAIHHFHYYWEFITFPVSSMVWSCSDGSNSSLSCFYSICFKIVFGRLTNLSGLNFYSVHMIASFWVYWWVHQISWCWASIRYQWYWSPLTFFSLFWSHWLYIKNCHYFVGNSFWSFDVLQSLCFYFWGVNE